MQKSNLHLVPVSCAQRQAVLWINPAFIASMTLQPHDYQGEKLYHAIVRTVDQCAFYVSEDDYLLLLSVATLTAKQGRG